MGRRANRQTDVLTETAVYAPVGHPFTNPCHFRGSALKSQRQSFVTFGIYESQPMSPALNTNCSLRLRRAGGLCLEPRQSLRDVSTVAGLSSF